jgi:outer membrane biosynthesis protein TonB
MQNTKKEWYKHGWGLLVAVLFFPYFIIWYAWAKSNWSKNIKIVLTSVIAIVMIPFTIVAMTTEPSDNNVQQNFTAPQEEPDTEALKKLEDEKAAEAAAIIKEAETKAAEEESAEQKRVEEEAAAAAILKRAQEQETTSSSNQTTPQATEESSNLPFKAICYDGTTSYQDTPSKTDYRGMCSGHDGIKTKLGRVQ